MTFLTVQKSKARSSTQVTKPIMKLLNRTTDRRYSTMALHLKNTWKKHAVLTDRGDEGQRTGVSANTAGVECADVCGSEVRGCMAAGGVWLLLVSADLCRDCSRMEPVELVEDMLSEVIDSLPPARPSGSSEKSLSPSDML